MSRDVFVFGWTRARKITRVYLISIEMWMWLHNIHCPRCLSAEKTKKSTPFLTFKRLDTVNVPSAGFWRKVILVIFELGPGSESLCNALPCESISCVGLWHFFTLKIASEALGTKKEKSHHGASTFLQNRNEPTTFVTFLFFSNQHHDDFSQKQNGKVIGRNIIMVLTFSSLSRTEALEGFHWYF